MHGLPSGKGEKPRRQPTSANRRNAVKSTGPRTAQGRAVSKMNALKHGILSQQVLVRGLNVQESRRELKALHRRFWEDLQPAGPLEEMLVDQIVTAHWRLRRALTAESGEIALNVDQGHRRRSRGTEPVVQWMQWRAFGDPIPAMKESSLGNAIIVDWLRELRSAVEAEGALTEEMVEKLNRRFGGDANSLGRQLKGLCQQGEADSEGVDAARREQKKTAVLAFLDREIGGFHFGLRCCADEESYEEEAQEAAAVLPSAEVLDKILRYETKLERQMYRAMAQLERVQRMRRGEPIPAPLSVEVSDRG